MIITQGKTKESRDDTIKTKLKDRRSDNAKWRKEKTMNDLQKEQTNNDTMCSQYSPIKKIIAKCTIRGPQPRREKVCKAK